MGCSDCGIQTARADLLRRERRSFRTDSRYYCPTCWAKKQGQQQRSRWWWKAGMAAMGALLVQLRPHDHFGWLLLNLVWLDACFIIAVTAHEFSHAFAGHLVGFRIFRIVIGTGRTWWRGSLFGFDVEAKVFPFSGVAFGTPREWEQTPWRYAFFILAGPLANACLLGLVILVKGPVWNTYAPGTFNGWLVFALANFATVLISLWPQTYKTAFGLLRSDGLLLLLLFSGKQRRQLLEDTHAAWFRLEAAVCTEQRRHAEARS